MALATTFTGHSRRLKPRDLKAMPLLAGMRTDADGKAVINGILLAVPEDEYALLRPHLEPVDLPQQEILYEPGEKIEFAYFPNEGMTSLVIAVRDGRSVEVGLVGKEGMVGTPLAAGMRSGPCRAIMQIAGSGLRIRSEVLQDTFLDAPELQLALNRYALRQGLEVAQLAACNRLHDIEQRLARWLLMCQDRVDSAFLPLTHEFLAEMLGTGRPSVSLASGILQRAGLIENLRGKVKILNRKQLEGAACECYGIIQNFTGTLGLR
ncbi:MAG: Crp/Fnr family transcriptional regulator [Terriglobales bacterium]